MPLGQGYLPAQDFHVLWNPKYDNTAWFNVDFGGTLETPERTFAPEHARRFRPK